MARDLYGELLSNALNRKAPRNHFAAYINPNEAAMLRSQGGGVAPGGGQYMANGMPSFQIEGIGGGQWGDDWGGGWGGGGAGVDFGGWGRDGETGQTGISVGYGDSGAEEAAATAEGYASDPERDAAVHQAALDAQTALAGSKNNTKKAQANLNVHLTHQMWNSLTPKERQEQLSQSIPAGGIGKYSPGAILSGQGATAAEIAHVNQLSPSGEYAVSDPSSDVSVPAGYHMGWLPSVMGSLIGMVNPVIGLATALSGFPTLGSRTWDAISEEIPEIGQVADFLSTPGQLAGDFLSQGFSPIAGALTSGAQGLGNFLQSNIGGSEPAVEASGPPSHGGFDPPFVDETLPETPTLVGNEEEEEEPFVSEVSAEMLARLERNAEEGRRQVEEHQRRLGMIA
jgi:hypothetical protein